MSLKVSKIIFSDIFLFINLQIITPITFINLPNITLFTFINL